MTFPTWFTPSDEEGFLRFYYPSHTQALVAFMAPGYVAPDEYRWERGQKIVTLADGSTVVYSTPAKWVTKKIVLHLNDTQRNNLASFLDTIRFAERRFEILPPHWQIVWVCRLAEARVAERIVDPDHWEVELTVRIEEFRNYNPDQDEPIDDPNIISVKGGSALEPIDMDSASFEETGLIEYSVEVDL